MRKRSGWKTPGTHPEPMNYFTRCCAKDGVSYKACEQPRLGTGWWPQRYLVEKEVECRGLWPHVWPIGTAPCADNQRRAIGFLGGNPSAPGDGI
jgi:hypothetical protein